MLCVSKYFFLLSLFFASYCAQAQQQVVDSLVAQLAIDKSPDTSRVKLLSKISSSLRSIDPVKMRQYGLEALLLSKKLGYEKGIGFACKNVSVSHWAQGNYEQALKFALEGLTSFEKINHTRGLISMYDMLGLLHEEQQEYDKALFYHQQVLRLNAGNSNKIEFAGTLNNMGTVHYKMKDYGKAIESFQKSLVIYENLGNKAGMAELYNNIGFISKDQGNYAQAVDYYLRSLQLAEEAESRQSEMLVCEGLGEVFILMKKYSMADQYLQRGLLVARNFGSKKWAKEIYGRLMQLATAQGNFEKAFEYQHYQHVYNDSLYNEEKSKQIAEMQVRYDSQKKEQAISQLQNEKKIQSLWRNFLIGGIILTVLLGLLIYQNLRMKNRKNIDSLAVQRKVNQQLEELDRMKSRFVTNISHEFRTPLTLILSPLQQQIASSLPDTREKEGNMLMYRNARRLLQLTDQLLDLSRLKNGGLKLRLQKGNLTMFMSRMANAFDSIASQKRIHYLKEIPEKIVEIPFDADKLEKIFYNLVSNALKFTPPEGTVNVSVTYLNECSRFHLAPKQISNDNFLHIKVSDTGPGIATAHLSKLFDDFYQVEETHTKPGIGVGLSIVKELVNLHQGFVDVESEAGRGGTFTVILPIHQEYYSIEEIALGNQLPEIHEYFVTDEAMRVDDPKDDEDNDNSIAREAPVLLVIEDNTDLRGYIKEIFKQFFTVYEAASGEEGLRIAQKHIPDIIVLDLMLPDLTGSEVCHTLKTAELTSHIPIVMLTAKADVHSKIEGLKTGADDYVTKPFHVEELQVRLLNLVNQREKLREQFQREIRVQPQNITVTPLDEVFLKKAIALVETNIASPELGVDMLIKELGMSRSQLHRKLKALTGQAAREFIRDLRLKRAAQLIEQKADSVTQIAFMVGFSDAPHFTKSFRKLFGKSPSEYAGSLN